MHFLYAGTNACLFSLCLIFKYSNPILFFVNADCILLHKLYQNRVQVFVKWYSMIGISF